MRFLSRVLTAVLLSAFALPLTAGAVAEARAAGACAGGRAVTRGRNEAGQKAEDGGTVVASVGPVALGDGPVRVALSPAEKASAADGWLGARVESLKQGRRVYLVARGLRADAPPGVIYNLYLDLPAGVTPGREDARYVGSLNFFDARGFDRQDAEGGRLRSFDITELVRTLRARKLLAARPSVTVIPAGAPENSARVEIDRLELFEQ